MPATRHSRNRYTRAACQLLFLCTISDYLHAHPLQSERHKSVLQGEDWVQELLNGHPVIFFEQTRMTLATFRLLQRWTEQNNRLIRRRNSSMSIEQMLIIFLWMVGHNASNRDAQTRFQHSGRTIALTFKRVLHALLPLYDDFVKPPSNDIPERLTRTQKDWEKFQEFQNVRGAIDGTHIHAFVPPAQQAAYRNRKGYLSQNVLAGCTLDMLFFYVLPGWEGSVHDARVLNYALDEDPTFPKPSDTYVYLADAGYGLKSGILVPYKKVRYHLREQALAALRPKTKEELFNLRHAQLRNTVERIFGVLKKRFRILDTPPQYSLDIQRKLVLVLCSLHNFIRIGSGSQEDRFYEEVDRELQISGPQGDTRENRYQFDLESFRHGGRRLQQTEAANHKRLVVERDNMAERMWKQYQNHLAIL